MPDGIGGMLTQRLGPLPIWVWGAAAIGGGYLVMRSGLLQSVTGGTTTGATQAAQQAQTAAGQATASQAQAQQAAAAATGQSAGSQLSQSIGLLQQLQQFQQQSYQGELQQIQQSQQAANNLQTPSGPSPVSQMITITPLPPNQTAAVLSQPVAGQIGDNTFVQYIMGVVPAGTQLPSAGPQVNGPVFCTQVQQSTSSFNAGNPLCSGQWQPVDFHGTTGYIWGPNVGVAAAQSGGPRIGAAHPLWRPGHPMLGGPRAAADITYPHYAVGGPRHVQQVAGQVGVHPARLLALNGHARRGTVPARQPMRVA